MTTLSPDRLTRPSPQDARIAETEARRLWAKALGGWASDLLALRAAGLTLARHQPGAAHVWSQAA